MDACLDSLVGKGYTGRHEVTVSKLREGIMGIRVRTSRLWDSLEGDVRLGL